MLGLDWTTIGYSMIALAWSAASVVWARMVGHRIRELRRRCDALDAALEAEAALDDARFAWLADELDDLEAGGRPTSTPEEFARRKDR